MCFQNLSCKIVSSSPSTLSKIHKYTNPLCSMLSMMPTNGWQHLDHLTGCSLSHVPALGVTSASPHTSSSCSCETLGIYGGDSQCSDGCHKVVSCSAMVSSLEAIILFFTWWSLLLKWHFICHSIWKLPSAVLTVSKKSSNLTWYCGDTNPA